MTKEVAGEAIRKMIQRVSESDDPSIPIQALLQEILSLLTKGIMTPSLAARCAKTIFKGDY